MSTSHSIGHWTFATSLLSTEGKKRGWSFFCFLFSKWLNNPINLTQFRIVLFGFGRTISNKPNDIIQMLSTKSALGSSRKSNTIDNWISFILTWNADYFYSTNFTLDTQSSLLNWLIIVFFPLTTQLVNSWILSFEAI